MAAAVGCSLATCQLARPAPTRGIRLAFLLPRRPRPRRTFASTAALRSRTDGTSTTPTTPAEGKDSKSTSKGRRGRPRVPTPDEAEQLRASIASTAKTSAANSMSGPAGAQRGSLGSGSIFEEDADGETGPDPLQTTDQRVPQRKKTDQRGSGADDGADGDTADAGKDARVKVTPLEERNMFNVERTLNPNPRARELWLRRKVIQSVQRRGKLTRDEQIRRTERASASRSHWFKTSLKKLGPLARQVAGKNIDDAILQMRFSVKRAAGDVRAFLEQAKNEAVVARGMGVNALRQQGREKELATVRADKVQKTRELHLAQQGIEELQRQLGQQPTTSQNVAQLTDLDPTQKQQREPQNEQQEEQQKEVRDPVADEKKTPQQQALSKRQIEIQRLQQMTLDQTKQRWQETMAQADAPQAETETETETKTELSVSSDFTSLHDRLAAHRESLTTARHALEDLSSRETDLATAITAARPEPVDIVLRDGHPLRIPDPSAIYISQAWVNRGPYGRDFDHRARGTIHMLRLPHTALSVVLKEEHSRIREAREREEREERRRRDKVWVQLPDRKVYGQRQYYCW